MPTKLEINDALLAEAMRIGGPSTAKDSVSQALRAPIERREQKKIVDLFGAIDVDASYNHKKQRRRSR